MGNLAIYSDEEISSGSFNITSRRAEAGGRRLRARRFKGVMSTVDWCVIGYPLCASLLANPRLWTLKV